MALNTNFNINPYDDDFDETKKFLKLLFKPGFAVQARELTQIQSLLQNQVEKFGNHIFKNGSVVTGGQFFIQDATYIKIENSYSGIDVDVTQFEGKTLLSNDETKRAEVIKVYDFNEGTGDPKTLMVKQLYGDNFVPGEIIKTSELSPFFATIQTSGVGTGQIFSVNEGVFYYDGFFISNSPQTVATSKYSSNTASARIGFEISESIINNNNDTSLLDPAQFSSNFQAPGADRYKIDLVLSTRSLDSIDDEQFIELARVENGSFTQKNEYPIYSVLEDTFARRTYDESGNYTVRPFTISLEDNSSNSAQTDIIVSPGKAYVFGYEFLTSSPTRITIDKPRTTNDVENRRISADYGNFIYTTNHFGTFPINNLSTVDLHCVNLSSINTTSTSTISNTKMGSARVKSIAYESTSNTSNAQTYQYRTYLFDVSVNSLTGNVSGGGSNTTHIQFDNATNFSSSNTAYVGSKFRITSGAGLTTTPRNIISYDGISKTVQISPALTEVANGQSLFSIDFEFKDVESISSFNSTTRINGADIFSRSKDLATPFEDVIFTDAAAESLIFNLGETYVSTNSISDMSFSYRRLYQNLAFGPSQSSALSLGTGESLSSGSSTSARALNYYITVTSTGTSPYTVGQLIPVDKFTVDTGSNRISVENANNMLANVVSTIDVSNISRKNKTYVAGNTIVQVSGGVDVFSNSSIISYPANGQTHITSSSLGKIPGSTQPLYVSDVIRVNKILDFRGNVISVANSTTATDITNRYTFDNGQRDSYYDHSSIKLKSEVSVPDGPIAIFYDRFSSTGSGFFTVDSYSGVPYGEIPTYSSTKNNTVFNLRDCLDFRPVRNDATSGTGNAVSFDVDSSTLGPKIPENGSDIILDFEYYLPRIDKLILDKTRKFEVIKGIPSEIPFPPNDSSTGMTLFILSYSPYVANENDIRVRQINHRRYTMRDIGQIEKRVENIEYYTALSLLEQETITKQDLTILDTQNLPRFKNGILVDSFKGHSIADVSNVDYLASIDPRNNELRPSFNISAHRLTFDSSNSSNYIQRGSLVTANSSVVSIIDQSKASKTINVNPFNIVNFLGNIKLYPPSDTWVDTDKKPEVLVNIGGDRDAWDFITQDTFNYEWDDWSTIWTGVDRFSTTDRITSTEFRNGGPAWRTRRDDVTQTTTNVTENQTRTGLLTTIGLETITRSLGDRVIDVSIIPFMRSINVLFVGTDFRPNRTLYPFFNGVPITDYVGNRVNKFYLANNNIQFNNNLSNPEVVHIRNKDTSTVNATAIIVHSSNNIAYLTNVEPLTELNFANVEVFGTQTNLSYDVDYFDHYGGNVSSATVNTVTLRIDALGANNTSEYVGSTIKIIQGTGQLQSRTIVGYDSLTRVATVSSNWTTIPSTDSFYSIGNLKSDESGSVVGIFTIPNGTFRVGELLFRLVDNVTGDLPSSSTNGDASFFAQGILQTTEESIISTIAPQLRRQSVVDERVLSSSFTTTTLSQSEIGGWTDPLAQTFLVAPNQYPEGIFLSKVRFCFNSKDEVIPVTLQIRPTVNGYPSSSVVYPFGSVSLTPDKVKVTEQPDLDDSEKYTEFVFDSPVCLQPGEHSFVLLANSNKYEVFIAEIGKIDLVTNRQISEQPYGGSLFLSQNGSTWTADQTSDLMFRLFRENFDTSLVTTQFLIDTPVSDVPYDLINLITSEIVLANTQLDYQFNSELQSGGFNGYQFINPLTNYEFSDEPRVLDVSTGNTTFTLQGLMLTRNPHVSPTIDVSRVGLLTVGNKINNLELSNSGIYIANTGSGYANSSDVTITISGGGGSGAFASANVVANTINAIYITDGGSGYTSTPTITITAGSGGGSGAQAIYNGETESFGGNSLARYITRRVTLADGFDSSDLRVYITANKPTGTNIHVYYKILSASDSDLFEDKKWQLMTQLGNQNFVSLNNFDYRELTFAPGTNGVPSNNISYTKNNFSFSTFRTFAIKIIMSSETTNIVPKIRDFRTIALPSG